MAALFGDAQNVDPFGIIEVDHRRAFGWQHTVKEAHLCVEISLKCLVIVEVILGKVRKPSRRQHHAIQTPLIEPVRGRLHRDMGHAFGRGRGQNPLQCDRIGCRVAKRIGPRPFNTCGAEVYCLEAKFRPDLTAEGRDRGFPIRARHRNGDLWLRTKVQRRCLRQGLTWVFGNNQTGAAIGQNVSGHFSPCAVRQNRNRTVFQRCSDKRRAVHIAAGHCTKERAWHDFATIDGDRVDPRIAGPLCGQS